MKKLSPFDSARYQPGKVISSQQAFRPFTPENELPNMLARDPCPVQDDQEAFLLGRPLPKL